MRKKLLKTIQDIDEKFFNSVQFYTIETDCETYYNCFFLNEQSIEEIMFYKVQIWDYDTKDWCIMQYSGKIKKIIKQDYLLI